MEDEAPRIAFVRSADHVQVHMARARADGGTGSLDELGCERTLQPGPGWAGRETNVISAPVALRCSVTAK